MCCFSSNFCIVHWFLYKHTLLSPDALDASDASLFCWAPFLLVNVQLFVEWMDNRFSVSFAISKHASLLCWAPFLLVNVQLFVEWMDNRFSIQASYAITKLFSTSPSYLLGSFIHDQNLFNYLLSSIWPPSFSDTVLTVLIKKDLLNFFSSECFRIHFHVHRADERSTSLQREKWMVIWIKFLVLVSISHKTLSLRSFFLDQSIILIVFDFFLYDKLNLCFIFILFLINDVTRWKMEASVGRL